MFKEYIEFAAQLSNESRKVIRPYFRSNIGVIDKDDESPVTVADRKTEELLRKLITEKYPDHGIVGEEFGVKQGATNQTWVLDPIDGTRSFICGAPWFGTLIAYLEDNLPIVGVIDIPMLNERWIGTTHETVFNGERCHVRTVGGLENASLFTTDIDLFEETQKTAFNQIKSKAKCVRYGTDCYAYGLLASGHIDLVIEAGLKPYDAMAHVPVIEGAGGVVTGWNGEKIDLNWDGRIVAAASATLHKEVLSYLKAM